MMNETHDTETPATAEPAFDTLVASFLSTASPPVQAWLIRSLARDAFVTAFAGFVFGVASTIVLAVGIVVAAPWFTSRAGRPKPAPEPHHMMVLTKDASGKLILHDPGGYDPRTGLPMSREEAIEAMEGIRP